MSAKHKPLIATLPVYELPVTIEQESGEQCGKCLGSLIIRFTHLIPFFTVAGVYLNEYRLEGYSYCQDCGRKPYGLPDINRDAPYYVMSRQPLNKQTVSKRLKLITK